VSKYNIKSLLTELFQFYVSIPNGNDKHELDRIIQMINLRNVDLKKILLTINGNIEKAKSVKGSNKTQRDNTIQIWSYVLSIFTKYLKG
jgi:hypothetical protein